MAHISEYEVEDIFIGRLESIGYKFIKLDNYDDVLANFREQLAKFNAKKLTEKGHDASFSDAEFNRIMIHVDNHSVYESAKILRDKYVLQLDNGESVYIDFFSSDTDRNIYQVTHQVTMDKAHKDDVVYKNRYDVTVLVNGLPLVQIELKRPGVEINEAINQINRYRKFSFKGIFRYLQLFVVSNSVQTKYFCNENEMMDGQYNPILKSLVFFWTDEKNTRINDLNTFTGEFFRKSAITEIMDKYMVIKTTEPVLMVMRPYQIYAVKAAKKRVLEVNQDGYVFACTGSGKTLTSFKLAQLLRDESMVDLVVFLIDRKDLDDQTVDEYNSFEKDCVDNTDSTAVLISMLRSSEKKMIVTTIQKMANAVKNPKYAAVMDAYKDKKVVFIIDECHRSQFGKMHGQIEKHFERANYIGFTGTPIFEKNKGADGRTTADIFHAGDKLDSCLHKYMIKDAIADGNVLRFSVEYQRTIFARKFDWDDLAVVMDENEYEGFKSWYLYYKDQTHDPKPKVPVPVDVDFDIELVRTDRINVVYILNLLKNANTHNKTEEEKQQDVDLILRELERSDNESLRLKKEIMRQFILTKFYDLPEDADVMEAFTQFSKEQMTADMEEFAFDNKIDYMIVSELFTEYVFHGTISDDDIRKRLTVYKLGLLKMTKLTKSVKTFVTETYNKYKAEGE